MSFGNRLFFGVALLCAMLAAAGRVGGAVDEFVDLPLAQKSGGTPLMDCLARRSTARSFDTKDMPVQDISNLLWSAFGINRPDGRRTAPSARNYQETDIYLLTSQGGFRYDPRSHRLVTVANEDIRSLGGVQSFVKDAPVTLVYVVDLARMGAGASEDRKLTAYIDVGFIAENANLYCAATGFATGVRMMIDRGALAAKLQLRDTQLIVLAQSVGYPNPGVSEPKP